MWVDLKWGWRIWYHAMKKNQLSFSLEKLKLRTVKISWFNLHLYNSCYNGNFALTFRTNQQWIKCSLICLWNIFSKKIVWWHILPFKIKLHITGAKRLIFVFHIHLSILWFSSTFRSKVCHIQKPLPLSDRSLALLAVCESRCFSQTSLPSLTRTFFNQTDGLVGYREHQITSTALTGKGAA